jgi:hypothetical protein
MSDLSGIEITTELLRNAAIVLAVIDSLYVAALFLFVKREIFTNIKWELLVFTALLWFSIWMWAVGYFWESVYHYVFPEWSRWLLPVFMALITAAVAGFAWKVSVGFTFHPVITYCMLGGLWGFVSHVIAVFRGITEKPPVLQGASSVAAVVFAIFEFIFYWCLTVTVSVLYYTYRKKIFHRTSVNFFVLV